MNKQDERRTHQRLPIEFGPVVVFKIPRPLNIGAPKIIKLGPIVDISKGGLAVHYIGDENRHNKYKYFSILTPQGEVASIDQIRYSIVSDVPVTKLPDSTTIRKRAMRFERLTGFQTARIAYLIHSLAPASKKKVATKSSKRRQKADIIRDIMAKFKAINAKEGDALPPLWLQDTYIPSLTSSEAKLVDQTIAQMVKLDLVSFVKEPIPHYKLSKKGAKFMSTL